MTAMRSREKIYQRTMRLWVFQDWRGQRIPGSRRSEAHEGHATVANYLFKAVSVKLWLFLAYVVSFVSLAASVGLLVQDALTDKGLSAWTGVAGVLQCVFVLISGLIFWTSHSE
ncbi:hypothetical protein Taro_044867 [Colocasia esculenta]|uniref:Uncharacterized protein n=1 Tax=Colocasia esculenta TaxID=4460 RepID=A0A843WV39_COLES|nr:hypothetical protein [Colocasia esculenta]